MVRAETSSPCTRRKPGTNKEHRSSRWSSPTSPGARAAAAPTKASRSHLETAIAVRGSKDSDGPKLVFGTTAWRSFASVVRSGRYDL
ncbi:DUF397 domain-containing protein [Actinomadura sp. 6N118]|uniref:DUF397 domain-containing protein n=1 Tax=Actinomadura sp. 6N118 TaxID=3375151 RepID=UPI00379D3923